MWGGVLAGYRERAEGWDAFIALLALVEFVSRCRRLGE
jgi:hypothetical protein